jgi:hypothetical protein
MHHQRIIIVTVFFKSFLGIIFFNGLKKVKYCLGKRLNFDIRASCGQDVFFYQTPRNSNIPLNQGLLVTGLWPLVSDRQGKSTE